MSDGSVYVVAASLDDLQERVVEAINADEAFVNVKNGDGQIRLLNPRLITALEEHDEEALTPGEQQILVSLRQPVGFSKRADLPTLRHEGIPGL